MLSRRSTKRDADVPLLYARDNANTPGQAVSGIRGLTPESATNRERSSVTLRLLYLAAITNCSRGTAIHNETRNGGIKPTAGIHHARHRLLICPLDCSYL